MHVSLILALFLCPVTLLSQENEPDPLVKRAGRPEADSILVAQKPELLNSGFIDVLNSGQLNASARLLRLYLGEPNGRFALPLSLYSGISSNSFQGNERQQGYTNNLLYTNFINPLSGLVNVSVEDILFFPRKSKRLTGLGVMYHVGERVLTGAAAVTTAEEEEEEVSPLRPVNFLNSFSAAGIYFQTGAWERNNRSNTGISWLAIRYIASYSNPSQLRKLFSKSRTNGFYHGYSLAWGIEISELIHLKIIYYKYLKAPEIEYNLPVCQFSFHYSLK